MPITPRMGDRFLMFALLNTDLAALACSWHWDVTKTWQAFNPQLDLAFKRTMYPPDFPATFDLLWGTYGDKLPEKMARPWFALQHHAECWTPMWASPFPTSPQPSKLATWGGFLWWSISAIGTKIDTVDEIIEGPKSASRITLGIIYHHLLSLAGIWFLSLLFTSPVCAWIPGGMPRRTRRWKRSGWARMYLWGWQLEKPGWMWLLDWCDKPWSYVLVEITWEILT